MPRHIGLTPVPDDADVEQFLESSAKEYRDIMLEFLKELRSTIHQTEDVGEPVIFAYGKMMNYLASGEMDKSAQFRLLCAALWELA